MAQTLRKYEWALLILALVTCIQILSTEGRPIKSMNKQELVSTEKDSSKDVAKLSKKTNLHQDTAKNLEISQSTSPSHNPILQRSMAWREMSPPMASSRSAPAAAHDKDDFQPRSPGVKYRKTQGKISSSEHSVTDFKPTTPGHSLGVGHYVLESDSEGVDPKGPGTSSSIQHSNTAFKPTTPGHSPGVGHIFSENDREDANSKASRTCNSSTDQHCVTAFGPTTPSHSPGVGHKLSVAQIEDTDPKGPFGKHSVTYFKDDFKPTAPGHSPGVGHYISVDERDEDVHEAPCTSSSTEQHSVKAFEPTAPGHSPGIRHPQPCDKSEGADLRTSRVEYSVTAFKDDFQPTVPGHSPGVGHVSQIINGEPKA